MALATLLTTLLLALAVAANPVVVKNSFVTLPISKRANMITMGHLLKYDQARAKALMATGGNGEAADNPHKISSPAENEGGLYIASVGVGCPPTKYDLAIDTGSSNTWVGAGKTYVKTSTSTKTNQSVSVQYGSGNFSGTEYIDQVTISPELVIPKQSIGVALNSTGFEGVDGILGIGPVDLTIHKLSGSNETLIPTVTDNLYSAGTIIANEIAISFAPITHSSGKQMNGEITWGGTNSSKYTGSINFVPITGTSPASKFWGIDQSILYGEATILPITSGIVDTGTTLILIATDAFKKYQSATGSTLDKTTKLLTITPTKFSKLQSLFFKVGSASFELTANAQIWPRALNTDIGGIAGRIYLIVNDLGDQVPSTVGFINGYTFLERFYSVYDTANKRVGLATTPFTTATTN